MKYTIKFMDLNGRIHFLYTNDQLSAHVAAGQLSIQFDKAEILHGNEVFKFSFGLMEV